MQTCQLCAQLCPTLCDPMDCSPPGSSVHGDSPGKNTGVACHALLQGIFPTQESNPDFPHCKWILYHLSQSIFLQGNFLMQELNRGLLRCRWILYQLSYQEDQETCQSSTQIRCLYCHLMVISFSLISPEITWILNVYGFPASPKHTFR